MTELIIGLVIAVLGLLGFSCFKSRQVRTLKTEARKAEDTARQREKEIAIIEEVQDEIEETESDEKPVPVEAPGPGDSGSRLERLNRLHQH
jgi:predicted negative regulator of RcsB-dependent stress response